LAPQPDRGADEVDEPLSLEPSDAEIEAWASRERERRERWLSGPTPEQVAAWASRERERRAAELEGARQTRGPAPSPAQLAQHSLRTAQLAAEGAMSLLFELSLKDALDVLVRAGRDWEEEFTRQPTPRRRGALDADSSNHGDG
jgi:hypothetical protein